MSCTHVRPLRRQTFAALGAVLGVFLCGPVHAAVTFTPWESLTEVVSANAGDGGTIMVVITQPDWCPPCITLDDKILRNPDEKKVARIAEKWTVIEVHGYEEADGGALKQHGVEFTGTPTTLVIQLDANSRRLRDGRLLGAIVGHPDDYADQLEAIAKGKIDISDLERRAHEEGSIHDWLELAEAYVERGQSVRARVAYRNLLTIGEDAAAEAGIDADSLRAIHRRATWDLISNVYIRLAGDYRVARHALDGYAEDYPSAAGTDDFVYVDSWTEAKLGRASEANGAMKSHFVDPGDAEGLLTYLYYAFRTDDEETWADAEGIVRTSLERYPDHAAALNAAHGRLLRRLARGKEALAAFQRAIDLTAEDDPKRAIYAGQHDYLKRNPIRLQ